MKNQINEIHEENPQSDNSSEISTKKITLPVIALMLDFLPFAVFYLRFFNSGFESFAIMLFLLCPIVGLILGVVAISKGKKVVGKAGMIIAILAVSLPLLLATLIILFYVGVSTGIIALM